MHMQEFYVFIQRVYCCKYKTDWKFNPMQTVQFNCTVYSKGTIGCKSNATNSTFLSAGDAS